MAEKLKPHKSNPIRRPSGPNVISLRTKSGDKIDLVPFEIGSNDVKSYSSVRSGGSEGPNKTFDLKVSSTNPNKESVEARPTKPCCPAHFTMSCSR